MKHVYSAVMAGSVAALLSTTGCQQASGGGCHYESWRGTCALRGVRTAKIIERFPQSFVAVEATYEPVSHAGEFSPPPFRKEVLAPAVDEADLTAFLKRQDTVDCAVDNPVGDPCAPKMVASIQQYIPPSTPVVSTGPVGCAKIERGNNTPVPTSATLPGPFQFDANSSLVTPAIRALADDAVRVIRQHPQYECVAIQGKSAPGEPFTLANERAQAVKKLLEERGIEKTRVIVFEATAPTYTASPDDQPVLSEHRRVHLAVVVYGGAP